MPHAREAEDLCLVVAMERPANNLMDLRECDRRRSLRGIHLAPTFFFVFEAVDDVAFGFFTETEVRFMGADLEEADFFGAEDFADVDLDGPDFFDFDLVEAVAGLADAGLEVSGGSASRR